MGGIKEVFTINEISAPVWTMGFVWVDPNTYQILRMRTELLEPVPQVGLIRQTTEISYGEFRLGEKGLSLWLPREVTVIIDHSNGHFRNFHRYGDYRLFTVESHEKHEPISPSPAPKKNPIE